MKIKDYIKEYYPNMEVFNNHEIINVTDNSKKVIKDSIFVAIEGYTSSGYDYIEEAINKGAKTIIVSNNLKNLFRYTNKLLNKVNFIGVDNPRVDLARLLKIAFINKNRTFPIMISVTGTAGKTTTSSIIYQVLKSMDYDVLLIGSNGYYSYYGLNEVYEETKNTTPSISTIYELIGKNKMNYDYVVIEVSSQGVVEGRVLGIDFDYSIITNFYKEHLEYHLNLSEYRNAKARILNQTKKAIVINKDISGFNFFNNQNVVKKITYGLDNSDFKFVTLDDDSIFLIQNYDKTYIIEKRLEGDFNILNIIGAFALLLEIGLNEVKLIDSINKLEPVIGRMNLIYDKNKKIYVDYAHTIIGVEKVLKYFNKIKKNKIISVIGCGGDRDKNRRPIIGKIVTTYSDLVIFTEDNSRNETTKNIINDIVSGVETDNYFIEQDRSKAIKLACDISKENDIVLILGKGNEKTIEINKKYNDFNDIEVVKKIMEGK